MKVPLVCVDRDGTINRDENFYLGSHPQWKDEVEFLPGVIEGLRLLNGVPDLRIFIVSNQTGIACADPQFALLTEDRAREVNEFIIERLRSAGAHLDGFYSCPFVDSAYVRKYSARGRTFLPQYLRDGHPDLKPRPGLVEKAAKSCGTSLAECDLFVVGDRKTDVELGLNAGGRSVLVSSFKTKELGDEAKVRTLAAQPECASRVFIAADFHAAATLIADAYRTAASE